MGLLTRRGFGVLAGAAVATGCRSPSSEGFDEVRAKVRRREAGSIPLREEISQAELVRFLVEAEALPVEIGLQIFRVDDRITRVINVASSDAGVFNPPPPSGSEYLLDLHTHPDPRPNPALGITPPQAAFELKNYLSLPSVDDVRGLLPSQVGGYVFTRGMLIRYERGRPIFPGGYAASVDGVLRLLGRVSAVPLRDVAAVDRAARSLVDRGVAQLRIVFPGGETFIYERGLMLEGLLQRVTPGK